MWRIKSARATFALKELSRKIDLNNQSVVKNYELCESIAERFGDLGVPFVSAIKEHGHYLFRSESIFLKTHGIMVAMDQFSRRIIGFSVHAGAPDCEAVCRMLNGIICGNDLPKRLSTDNDPLFKFCRFKTNFAFLK